MFFPAFFFNETAPTEIYTLSLHDALPILRQLDWDQWQSILKRLQAISDHLGGSNGHVAVHPAVVKAGSNGNGSYLPRAEAPAKEEARSSMRLHQLTRRQGHSHPLHR